MHSKRGSAGVFRVSDAFSLHASLSAPHRPLIQTGTVGHAAVLSCLHAGVFVGDRHDELSKPWLPNAHLLTGADALHYSTSRATAQLQLNQSCVVRRNAASCRLQGHQGHCRLPWHPSGRTIDSLRFRALIRSSDGDAMRAASQALVPLATSGFGLCASVGIGASSLCDRQRFARPIDRSIESNRVKGFGGDRW